jgi:hypothetical protein
VHGFSTLTGRALARARGLFADTVRLGRRPVTLGALLLVIGSTATVVAGTNTSPTITSLTVSSAVVDEGQTVTLFGRFSDPDVADRHTLKIRWHDGSPKEAIQLPAGPTSFTVTHTYLDNLPPSYPQQIFLTLYDRTSPGGQSPTDNTEGSGQVYGTVPIQVRNVAPRFVTGSIVGTATAGGVVVEGDFTDPGSADVIQLTGAVGNPDLPNQNPMACTIGPGERHFRCQYAQQPNLAAKTYNVALIVRDDDGGRSTHTMSVRFNGLTRP